MNQAEYEARLARGANLIGARVRVELAQPAYKKPEDLRAEADAIEAAQAAEVEAAARREQLVYDSGLARSTAFLLTAIGHADKGTFDKLDGGIVRFRKELTPLAAAYGYRIVVIGDRTEAILSR